MTHPTDAELSAAIDRGIADGTIIELTPEVLDAMAIGSGVAPPSRLHARADQLDPPTT